MTYVYEPLKHPKSIRLLELLPGPKNTQLECNLFEANLSDYSYGVIYCTSFSPEEFRVLREASTATVIRIADELYRCLWRLREAVQWTSIILWVDTICINASDHQERSCHIEELENIYQAANSVITHAGMGLSICVHETPFELWERLRKRPMEITIPTKSISQWAHRSLKTELQEGTKAWLASQIHKLDALKNESGHFEAPKQCHMPYVYRPLQNWESIRVLDMSTNLRSSSISCKIVEVDRRTSTYFALSYVWGAPNMSEMLHEQLSGASIPVTKTLSNALCTLSRHHEHRPLQLWVDAICIDQSNPEERSHQVKTMASIYSKAIQVFVWLGPEMCGTALQDLATIGVRGNDLVTVGHHFTGTQLADALKGVEHAISRSDIANVDAVLANPWFTRVWILQEFLLAKDVLFFAGPEGKISYESFRTAISILKRYDYLLSVSRSKNNVGASTDDNRIAEGQYVRNLQLVHDMTQARASLHSLRHRMQSHPFLLESEHEPDSRSLYQWCRMLVNRGCADERDKVYAALGLTTHHLDIVPDYNLSFADVRLDLTKKSLFVGDFSVLHDAETQTRGSSLSFEPSFVPSLRRRSRRDRPLPLGGYEEPKYSAGLSRAHFVQSSSPKQITIRGISVGEVNYLDNFDDVLYNLTAYTGSYFMPQIQNAYERTRNGYACSTSVTCLKHLDDYMKLSFWRTINLGFLPARDDVPYFERGLNFQFLDLPYRQNIARCFENRVFFMTSSGHMGLGPKWLQRRDKIVIFDGAETPFLLRDAGDDTWKLVGDCYVDCWMDGRYNGRQIESAVGSPVTNGGSTGPDYAALEKEVGEPKATLKSEFFTLC